MNARTPPAVSRARRRALLATVKPLGGGEDGVREVLAPCAPVVSSRHDQEAVANPQPRELVRKGGVLGKRTVAATRVEPDVRPVFPKPARNPRQVRLRAVVGEALLLPAEDRENVVGALVAGPAFEHPELARVVHPD